MNSICSLLLMALACMQGPQIFVVRSGTGQAYLRNPPGPDHANILQKDIMLKTGSESLLTRGSVMYEGATQRNLLTGSAEKVRDFKQKPDKHHPVCILAGKPCEAGIAGAA